MIIKLVVKNGFAVGLLCDLIIACTITNPSRYRRSSIIISLLLHWAVLMHSMWYFCCSLLLFFLAGIATSWCNFTNKSHRRKLFSRHRTKFCFSHYTSGRCAIVFSCRHRRGIKSLDCRHQSCIKTKWSMAGSEYAQFTSTTKQHTTSRLFWIFAEIRQSLENMVETILCAQRCMPILLFRWKQQKCIGYVDCYIFFSLSNFLMIFIFRHGLFARISCTNFK